MNLQELKISGPLAAVLVFLGVFLFYLPSVSRNLIWDDEGIISSDHVIRDISKAGYIFTPAYWKNDFPGSGGRYRPLRALTFMLERQAWGENPAASHQVNAALHAAAALALFWLAWLLGLSVNRALFAALLFGVHPAGVEAVAWIKNRTDIMAALFCLLSLALYIKAGAEGALRRWFEAGSLLAFLLALLSKETAVVFPLLPFAWSLTAGEGRAKALRRALPYAVLAGIFLAFVLSLFKAGALSAMPDLKWGALGAAAYLRLLFLPLGLNLERLAVTPLDLAGPLLYAGLVWAAFRAKSRTGLFLAAGAGIALLPLLDLRLVASRPLAEERLYFAIAFTALCAGSLVPAHRFWKLGAVLAGVLFAGLSLSRMADWRDPVRLWEDTARKSPGSARTRVNLGLAYERAGRIREAVAEYENSIALDPAPAQPYINIAAALMKAGRQAEAEKLYLKALANSPGNTQALLGLGRAALDKGDPDGAAARAGEALAARPAEKEALNMLGVACMMKGDLACAGDNFGRVLALDRFDPKALYNLANLARMSGDLPLAISHLETLRQVEPDNLDAANNLAILLDMTGREDAAVAVIRDILSRDKGYYQANYNMGLIYERRGRLLEALAEFTRALELNPKHAASQKKADEIRGKLK